MRHQIALVLFLSTFGAAAEPIDALKPMAFLAGSCWKGEFPDGKQSDEHCFTWMYDGKALRDVHTVRAPGRPDYAGETIYFWDSANKRLEYLYVENLGGFSRGTVDTSKAGVLRFPPAQYVADGQTMTYRARWTLSDAAYEAWNETQGKDGWITMTKLTLKRVSK